MPRRNVYLPDELADLVERELPDVNLSALLQQALQSLLGCDHARLRCAGCAAPVERSAIADAALSAFYRDVMWDLHPLVSRGGTAEGAARVVKAVAQRNGHRVSAADAPLPRPNRTERHKSRVKELPTAHPSAHQPRRKTA